MGKLGKWMAERVPISVVELRELTNEPVPNHLKKWWFALGGTPAYLFVVQIVTGILLAFSYQPSPTTAYQSLRRGGITGCGTCGAVRAGEAVLGELLGDPDPTGSVTPALRDAIVWYQDQVAERIDKGTSPDLICRQLPTGSPNSASALRTA